MQAFEATLTGVGVAGSIATVVVTRPYKDQRVARIVVVRTAGSCTKWDTEVSTDSAVAAAAKRVAKFTGDTPANPADYDNQGRGYAWAPADAPNATEKSSSELYVKVTPDAGADNNFTVRLYFAERGGV